MILKVVLFVIVPLLAEARLTVNITVASHKKDIVVKTSGTDVKLNTDIEVEVFNITRLNINRGFRIELGKVPDNYFLKDPTPYDGLFKRYKWEPVRRKMYIKKVEILETIPGETISKLHKYTNNASGTERVNASGFMTVENVIYSTWPKSGVPDDDIFYDLIVNLNNNHFRYVNKWRDDQIRTKFLDAGMSEKGYFEVKPSTTITTKLTLQKTIVLVKIIYAAYLTGSVIGDYESLYGKYHFYAPSVRAIMKAANMKNEVLTTELIEIRCFTSPKLEVYDENGRKVNIIRPLVPLFPRKKARA